MFLTPAETYHFAAAAVTLADAKNVRAKHEAAELREHVDAMESDMRFPQYQVDMVAQLSEKADARAFRAREDLKSRMIEANTAFWAMGKDKIMDETIEQFLARGGAIKTVPMGASVGIANARKAFDDEQERIFEEKMLGTLASDD